jgi:DNA-binding HxlR family transcriptional regulator
MDMTREQRGNEGGPNVLSKNCPSNSVLEMVAGKWQVLILYTLRGGKRRYSELQHTVEGISQKMLTQTLRELERNGLVKRTSYPVVPPHTEYELTELGASLEDIVYRLGGWAQENIRAVLEARKLTMRSAAEVLTTFP